MCMAIMNLWGHNRRDPHFSSSPSKRAGLMEIEST